MSETFDAYHKWLGIPPTEQPPNHYRLLGIPLFETDADVIANAADKQMAHIRSFQTGQHSVLSQKLLNEIAAARVCLLNPAKKPAYDVALRRETARALPKAALIEAQPAAPPAIPRRPQPTRRKNAPWQLWAGIGASVVMFLVIVIFALPKDGKDKVAVHTGPRGVRQSKSRRNHPSPSRSRRKSPSRSQSTSPSRPRPARTSSRSIGTSPLLPPRSNPRGRTQERD